MIDIGATLREARMRTRIDVSEVEAKTKIRAKYLRALENEEWDLLPGPTFVRSFLRTYAHALGLDGKALVEEYRLRCEPPSEAELQPVMASSGRPRPRPSGNRGSRPSRGYVFAIVGVSALIVLLLVGLLSGKNGGSPAKTGKAPHRRLTSRGAHSARPSSPRRSVSPETKRVALSFQPSAPVYVCLIGENGRRVIPGVIIQPPYTPVTYHSSHFDVTFGNNAVTMYVDGKAMTVPSSSQAIGYSISKAARRPLTAGKLPTCR
jgi:cytoskeleton protein RodZ